MPDSNDELYVHEHYKSGSKEQELTEFKDHVRRVLEAQKALAAEHSGGSPQRVFHAKSHGCLAGRLILLDDRPDSVRHGLFGDQGRRVYNVLARFSSGVGFDQHDLKPDVRGLALKIFGVGDGADGAPQGRTVDFLMTNSTNPFGRDQEEFVQFMEANVRPGPLGMHLINFLIHHTEVAGLLLKAAFRVIPSLATQQYWSGHPYLLGMDRAMKFNVRPMQSDTPDIDDSLREHMSRQETTTAAADDTLEHRIRGWFDSRTLGDSKVNANYLSRELHSRLQRGPIRFVFSVQLEKDPQTTPIEDGLAEWKEDDSPSIAVAELVLDREIDADICRTLSFTPGHFLPEHRPLGNLGRGRIFTYEASRVGRSAAGEPDERMLFGA